MYNAIKWLREKNDQLLVRNSSRSLSISND